MEIRAFTHYKTRLNNIAKLKSLLTELNFPLCFQIITGTVWAKPQSLLTELNFTLCFQIITGNVPTDLKARFLEISRTQNQIFLDKLNTTSNLFCWDKRCCTKYPSSQPNGYNRVATFLRN